MLEFFPECHAPRAADGQQCIAIVPDVRRLPVCAEWKLAMHLLGKGAAAEVDGS